MRESLSTSLLALAAFAIGHNALANDQLKAPPVGNSANATLAAAASSAARSGIVAAGPFIAAIQDDDASIVRAKPECVGGTGLRGMLVIETPKRAGFPFDATTFAGPRGIFTNVISTGNESPATIGAVAQTLNDRATLIVKKLLQNCSL